MPDCGFGRLRAAIQAADIRKRRHENNAEAMQDVANEFEIKRVGVIGAGQMGNGIAHVFALSGFDVVLHDISSEKLTNAVSLIGANINRQVVKGRVSEEDKDAALSRIGNHAGNRRAGRCGSGH